VSKEIDIEDMIPKSSGVRSELIKKVSVVSSKSSSSSSNSSSISSVGSSSSSGSRSSSVGSSSSSNGSRLWSFLLWVIRSKRFSAAALLLFALFLRRRLR
jgi:hypothetical protein